MIKFLFEWGEKFGFKELLKRPFQIVFAPIIIKFKKQRFFVFNKKQFPLFYHRYNFTWTKERAVEIPIAMEFIINSKGKTLEIGNVLSHYFKSTWDIVDKYEKGRGVINEDIETFSPFEKYDLIVSVSTFEHIGFDSELNPKNSHRKISATFKNIENNCLKKGGKLLVITPLGYNQAMDEIIFTNHLHLTKISFLGKKGKYFWSEVDSSEARRIKYGRPFAFANGISIVEHVKN